MQKFTTPIQATMHDNGELWRLETPFIYWTNLLPNHPIQGAYNDGGEVVSFNELSDEVVVESSGPITGYFLVIPKGFITDFASVPRLFRWYVGPTGKHAKAAVVHDWLYRNNVGNREWADAVFYEAMKVSGVNWFMAKVMWLAVRIGGHWTWDDRDVIDWESGKVQ